MLEALRRMVPGGGGRHLETGDAGQVLMRKSACECGQPPHIPLRSLLPSPPLPMKSRLMQAQDQGLGSQLFLLGGRDLRALVN